MPRTTNLKIETLPAEGVHKLVDCPLCEKKGIRSDNFSGHFQTHINKLDVSTAEEMQTKFDDLYLVDQILVQQRSEGNSVKNVCGVCFECHKYIRNKDKKYLTLDTFEEHVCREKKAAEKVLARMPPKSSSDEMKQLWTSIINTPGLNEETKAMMKLLKEDFGKEYSEAIQEGFYKLSTKALIADKGFLQAVREKLNIPVDERATEAAVLDLLLSTQKKNISLRKQLTDIHSAHEDSLNELTTQHIVERSNLSDQIKSIPQLKGKINEQAMYITDMTKEIKDHKNEIDSLQDCLAEERAARVYAEEQYMEIQQELIAARKLLVVNGIDVTD